MIFFSFAEYIELPVAVKSRGGNVLAEYLQSLMPKQVQGGQLQRELQADISAYHSTYKAGFFSPGQANKVVYYGYSLVQVGFLCFAAFLIYIRMSTIIRHGPVGLLLALLPLSLKRFLSTQRGVDYTEINSAFKQELATLGDSFQAVFEFYNRKKSFTR